MIILQSWTLFTVEKGRTAIFMVGYLNHSKTVLSPHPQPIYLTIQSIAWTNPCIFSVVFWAAASLESPWKFAYDVFPFAMETRRTNLSRSLKTSTGMSRQNRKYSGLVATQSCCSLVYHQPMKVGGKINILSFQIEETWIILFVYGFEATGLWED